MHSTHSTHSTHCNATLESRRGSHAATGTRTVERDIGATVLDRLCRYIRSRLEEPITLVELAETSGRTTRCIQYAFRRRFGCSPTEWIRRERLSLAHRRLVDATANTTVCDVAFASGFNHLSMFARYYRQRFNEAPSATLARAAGRVRGGRPLAACPSRCVDIALPATGGAAAVAGTPTGVLH